MDSYKVGIESDSDNCAESEILSISDASSQDENRRTRGGTEPKNQMKLRSIKFSRLPSFRSCLRPMKSPSSQRPSLLSGYAASSEQSTPVQLSDASPEHTKAASSSHSREETYQKSARTFSRRASFKPVKSLSRMSSMKFRRPLMRKPFGGTDQKKKLKKTRSIKLASSGKSRPSSREDSVKYVQPSVVLSSEADKSPKYSKARLQVSHHNSESCFTSNGQNKKNSKFAKAKSDSSASVLKRSSTLRPQRILTKTVSFKSKRPSRKCSEVSEISDSSVERATCSSTLKDSKFTQHIEPLTGGSDSRRNSAVKVCPYTYCALHGTLPPLKHSVSMRKRLIKQKSTKPESRSVPKAKHSSNRRKGTHSSVTAKDFKVELKDDSAQDVEDKHIDVSGNLTEISLDETSYPQSSSEQHKSSGTPKAKQQIQVAFSEFKETSQECQCIAVESIKTIPEASNAEMKAGEIVASSSHGGDDKPISNVDHHKNSDSSLEEVKNSKKSDNLSVMLDHIASSSIEGDPADATVHDIVNEAKVASLNSEILKGDSESNIGVLEASTTNRVHLEEKDEDSEPDNCFLEGFSSSGDTASNSITDECHKTQTKKQKFTGFWGLIYQQMVSGITTDVETRVPLDGKSKEEQDEGNHTLPQNENPVAHQSASGTDQEMAMRVQDAGDHKFELWQSNAVKLVQEAFDKILSEIPEQSSDDQSIGSDITSEQDFLQKKEEQNISSSFNGTEEGIACDPEETQLEISNINAFEEDKAASQLGYKSNQKISKNWSNLKKIIILKRFVKALEKVRNFNPRKPRFLEVEPDPETEKVHLKHQTVEERKSADEWMLDYALRQVISTLAPAQKRKVALLVQAFETVSLPEIKTHLRSIPTGSSHATPVQGCNHYPSPSNFLSKASYPEMNFKETLDQVSDRRTAEHLIPGTCSELKEGSLKCGCSNKELGTPVSKTAQPYLEEEKPVACILDDSENNSIIKNNQPAINSSPRKLEELTSSDDHSPKLDGTEGTLYEKLESGKFLQEIYDSEVHDHTKCNSEKLETVNVVKAPDLQSCQPKSSTPEYYEETKAVSGVISSSSFSELLEETTSCGGEANPGYEIHLDSSPPEGPESNETIDTVQDVKMEKQKYMRLWYLIHKHMVSGSGEGGTQSLLQGADYKEKDGYADTLLARQGGDSNKDFSEMNQAIVADNQNASSQRIESSQIEAIKLIEKAIDEINLPDIQDDSSDDQSITGSRNAEMEIPKTHVEDREAFISNYTDSAEDTFRESNNKMFEHRATLDPETRLNSSDIRAPEESETVSKLGNNSKPQTQKSWSNLKKLILLKRFLKAVEKVRKFNPHEPRYLPMNAEPEAEKVHLRHQSTEDRKNAEEWMLDYALQEVVAKLTPARKRKVELLVEAFETVTPTLEGKNHRRHNAATYPRAKLILA